jgi:hypothetical protein
MRIGVVFPQSELGGDAGAVRAHVGQHRGHPQLDAIVLEQRRHRGVLGAVAGTLLLADHDRVPPGGAADCRSLRD